MYLYDLTLVEAISKNDPSFVGTLINLFLESIPNDLVELNESYSQNNWNKFSHIAHKLKSTIDTLGINSIAETIREIETLDERENRNQKELEDAVNKVTTVLNEVIIELKLRFPKVA